MGRTINRKAYLAVAIGVVVAIDLVTKLAAAALAEGHTGGPVVPVRNPEFSLGVAGASRFVMLAISAAGILVAAALVIRPALDGRLPAWVPIGLLGGAAANLIDRSAFGSVHDFIVTPWIVFNLADVAVVAGIVGLIAHRLRCGRQPQRAHDISGAQ
jgi:signal peptidase II